ncbi:LysR family transcriptional regulator [Leucobacter viscericola]|uniref:LysR family transcriptional regulator n=1 Tax=Leucobacter viscericola TaxID=2714935 RepID=A0A6G7XIW4_9MICO|nr:LysR substrate-binding domain-containing protein [Leucobacter viscericola]QIK64426.1 LysR family transcriptional regulator [Leucobacter viscericola]
MEQQQVLAFLALAEELHFGRAAQRLFLTQPTLSRTIRGLEQELGVALFERSSRSVRLTPAGSALVQPAEDLRDSHDRAVASVTEAAAGLSGTVTLAFTGAASYRLAARIAALVAERHPGVTLRLFSTSVANEGLNQVLDHSVDAVLGRWGSVPAGISSRRLAREDFVVAVPSSHRLAGRGSVAFGEIAQDPFIHLPEHPRSVLRERLSELSERYGVTPDTVRSAPDSWTALALVGEGLGITLTISSVRDNTDLPGIEFLDLSDDGDPAWLSLAWLTRYTNSAVVSVLRCAEAAASELPNGISTDEA